LADKLFDHLYACAVQQATSCDSWCLCCHACISDWRYALVSSVCVRDRGV